MGEARQEALIVDRFTGEVRVTLLDQNRYLGGSSSALHLDPAPIMTGDERPGPQSKGCRSQNRVGHFNDDAADVLVTKEIAAGELQIVLRTFHVAEERVAPPASEQAIVSCARNPNIPTGGNGYVLENTLLSICRIAGSSETSERRGLCTTVEWREAHLVRDIGNRIAVRINLQLVDSLGRERHDRRGARGVLR